MDKQQAQTIIKTTFENPFDKDRFTGFAKNLLNQIDDSHFAYYGKFIPDAYKPFISRYERIGKYSDSENRIDILVVYLNKETSIERARTRQRNFIAGYLEGKYGSDVSKDAALVAFVSPNEEDWRFSLVKMDYKFEQTESGKMKVKEEFTPARRWSFLVGKNESSHTAQSRLVPILTDDRHNPTLAQLEEAFNIEKVTKEFFEKYRELFLRTKETLDEIVTQDSKIKADFEIKGVDAVNFAKKLLGQIVFLYFLQKKGWFGVERDAEWGTGTKHFLRELFSRRDEFPKGGNDKHTNFFNDILEPLFYEALRIDRRHDDDYYKYFNSKIPFLNGGLFDPINNYDWVHTDILLPNELFSNRTKTKEGDTGNGILDVFDRYNFTVKEDEPLEKEVAVDPEMLGKVFENLLAVKDRKSKGTYYTPREIVHYMCQQSLINYLHTEFNKGITSYQKIGDTQTDAFGNEVKTGQFDLIAELKSSPQISKEDLETLIKYGEQVSENEAIFLEKEQKIKKGEQKTTSIKTKLPDTIRKNAELIDGKLADITVCDPAVGSGAFPVGMMHEIVKTRNVLTTFLNPPPLDKWGMKSGLRTIYRFKRDCIEKSLYGVDIDPGAVEIAKLRLWLSLVVDEEDIKRIKPLPNLDYKIVCGNSLLGVKRDLLNDYLFKELEQLKPLYFNETNPTKKQEYKQQIDELISRITDGHKEFDFEVYFSEVFHEKKGFDVVIANPPYVNIERLDDKLKQYIFLHYQTCLGRTDIYTAFIENSLALIKDSGLLTFIIPYAFTNQKYGTKLRKHLIDNFFISEILDTSDYFVFETANVKNIVLRVQKTKNERNTTIKRAESADDFQQCSLSTFFLDQQQFLDLKDYRFETKYLSEARSMRGKILLNTLPLEDICFVAYGARLNHKTKKIGKDHYISESYKSTFKPYLEGKNIERYYFAQYGWLSYHPKEHYNPMFAELFENPKLVTINVVKDELRFAFDNKNFYNSHTVINCVKWHFLVNAKHISVKRGITKKRITNSSNYDYKYLLAILNSKLMSWYFMCFLSEKLHFYPNDAKSMPIKTISTKDQNPFTKLVDRIFVITKAEDYLQNPQKQAQVKALEREIDRMVYKLYGLTKDEIAIIENSGRK